VSKVGFNKNHLLHCKDMFLSSKYVIFYWRGKHDSCIRAATCEGDSRGITCGGVPPQKKIKKSKILLIFIIFVSVQLAKIMNYEVYPIFKKI
jgi:hypothetical protein